MRVTSVAKIIQLVTLVRTAGWSVADAAAEVALARSTAYDIIRREDEDDKEKRGRKPKLSTRSRRAIVRHAVRSRADGGLTAAEIKHQLGVAASVRTVRRVLNDAGYRYLPRRQKSFLSKEEKQVRLAFGREHLSKTADWWEANVHLWLDCKGFRHEPNGDTARNARRKRMYRLPSEGLHPHCVNRGYKESLTPGGKMVKVCAGFGNGKPVLRHVIQKINGPNYASWVGDAILPAIEEAWPGLAPGPGAWVLCQDHCPCQNSAIAVGALGAHGIERFAWPRRSQDLMPCETWFAWAEKEVRDKAPAQENYAAFKARVVATLAATPESNLRKLIRSMPKRMRLLVQARGGRIKY